MARLVITRGRGQGYSNISSPQMDMGERPSTRTLRARKRVHKSNRFLEFRQVVYLHANTEGNKTRTAIITKWRSLVLQVGKSMSLLAVHGSRDRPRRVDWFNIA